MSPRRPFSEFFVTAVAAPRRIRALAARTRKRSAFAPVLEANDECPEIP
jgi:hypothetical protein